MYRRAFHQNANPFALGPRVGLDNFALEIPTCCYPKTHGPNTNYHGHNANWCNTVCVGYVRPGFTLGT